MLWRDPDALPGPGPDGALPEFGPGHTAMAAGRLRWITPSAFIAKMGGPSQVGASGAHL